MQHRRSRQRERILELLRSTDSHPTADWVYGRLKDEIPGLSMGTVYRNLKVLEEEGYIRKLPFGSTHDRFDANTAPHYHLVCERCGSIEDFEMPLYAGLNENAERISRFKITYHRIDFFGLCANCQHADARQTNGKER
jgi:Fur family peroxide stress response transcriptional regulator